MTADMITDLKQFISDAIFQQTNDIRQNITGIKADIAEIKQDVHILKHDVEVLKQDVDDLSVSVGEALHASNEAADEQFKNHARRILRLERKTA